VTATEAFNYADTVRHSRDTPVSADNPSGVSAYIFLGLLSNDPLIRQRIPSEKVKDLIPTLIPEFRKGIANLKPTPE
jgi:hypothetical protein